MRIWCIITRGCWMKSIMPIDATVEIKEIAKEANNYARERILEGSSQLANNNYDPAKKMSLYKAVTDVIKIISKPPIYSLEFDVVINKFERTIKYCNKFSLGNCYELALMSLDFIINNYPDVLAEIYHIRGGDHALLIIGRAANSNPTQPETWGQNAYICDPWSNKTYPASLYLSETKNFYFTVDWPAGTYTNFVQDFDRSIHLLCPMKDLNSTYLKQRNSVRHIKAINNAYNRMNTLILDAVDHLVIDLEKITFRLAKKYSNLDQKYIILMEKIIHLRELSITLRHHLSEEISATEDYRGIKEKLENKLNHGLKACRKYLNFSAVDKEILTKYRNETSLLTKFLKWFGIKPKTVRDTNKSLVAFNKRMTKLIHVPPILNQSGYQLGTTAKLSLQLSKNPKEAKTQLMQAQTNTKQHPVNACKPLCQDHESMKSNAYTFRKITCAH